MANRMKGVVTALSVALAKWKSRTTLGFQISRADLGWFDCNVINSAAQSGTSLKGLLLESRSVSLNDYCIVVCFYRLA